MKKIVRLTEQDLSRLVEKVMNKGIEGDNWIRKILRKASDSLLPSLYSPEEKEVAKAMLDAVKNGKYKILDPFKETKKDYIVGSIYFCSPNDCYEAKLKKYLQPRHALSEKKMWMYFIDVQNLSTAKKYLLPSGEYNKKIFDEIMR